MDARKGGSLIDSGAVDSGSLQRMNAAATRGLIARMAATQPRDRSRSPRPAKLPLEAREAIHNMVCGLPTDGNQL